MNATRQQIILLGLVFVIGLMMSPAAVAQTEDIKVSVSLSRDRIGMDETASLMVKVAGSVRNLPAPELPTLSSFEVYSQGQSSNYQIMNGVASASVTYRYALLPKKAGSFPISNIAVVYNNKRYKGNNVQLTVVGTPSTAGATTEERARRATGEARTAFLEAEVDNKNPYVNEQIIFTLKFYISTAARHSTPDLTRPTTTGFWWMQLGNSTTFRQRINGTTYQVYEIKLALFPTQTGELTIGRALIKCTVGRDFFMFGGQEVSARSRAIKIKVKPLPTAGKPANFTGTIGKFNLQVAADKTEVKVNQPITVTVRMSGTGNIKPVAEPIIPESNDFRVYLASSKESVTKGNDRVGGTKIFEEVFVPRRAGKLEIPSLQFNFFNPKTGRYEEVASRPIAIKVTGGDGKLPASDLPYVSTGLTVPSEASDIRYLKEDLGRLSRPGFLIINDPIYLMVNALPLMVFIGMVLLRRRRERFSGDIGYARSRQAAKQAHKRLARARSLAAPSSAEAFYAEISQALISFVADKLNISPHGLTSDRLTDLLSSKGADELLVTELLQILQQADFARYSSQTLAESELSQSLDRAEKLMTRLGGLSFE